MTEHAFLQIVILMWLAACAIADTRKGEVPNALTLPAVMAGAILSLSSGWDRTAVFAAIMAVTVLMYTLGFIGGGDAKILIALGGLWPQLFLVVVLGVSVWGLARRAIGGKGRFRAVLPMAVAALATTALRVIMSGLSPM
jgi:Flp pilus assembly protein protease CpaA